MGNFALVVGIIALITFMWSRWSPTNPDEWHLDPADVDDSAQRSFRLIGREAPRFSGPLSEVLQEFSEVALSEPGVKALEGDISEGMMTFVARAPVTGTRDVITVKAVAEGANTKVSVISRQRMKLGSDAGRNRDRLDRWLAELQLRFA
ncbi:MAG: DUF1499 domain-containing protein [Boseongicola sp.]|nr:MAG: DUF1499 domain-containing protein [Boseongicola sp.]